MGAMVVAARGACQWRKRQYALHLRHRAASGRRLRLRRLPPFELGVVVEVFGLERPELDVPWWYELASAAERPGPLRRRRRLPLRRRARARGARGARTPSSCPAAGHGEPPPAVLDAVRAAHARGARLVSICSGAFLLAAAGLLDGREAATHWRYAAALAEALPAVGVNADVLYVDDGDVLTSAGQRRRDRPVPAHRAPRPRRGRRQRRRAPAGRDPAPRRRAGAADRAADAAGREDDPIARVMAWALERLDERLDLRSWRAPRTSARARSRAASLRRRARPAAGCSSSACGGGRAAGATDAPVENVGARSASRARRPSGITSRDHGRAAVRVPARVRGSLVGAQLDDDLDVVAARGAARRASGPAARGG